MPADPVPGFEAFEKTEIEQALFQRFESRAARFADRPALETGAGTLRYGELEDAANRVARTLLERSGPEEGRVALIFRDPLALVPALLGTWKAGKVYVPVDPSTPAARVAATVSDARAEIVLADAETAALAGTLAPAGSAVIDVSALPGTPAPPPGLEVPPDRIASIFYTSGSTGTPKGVMQSHRNLLQHIRNYTNAFRIGPGDRVSLLFSYGFGAAMLDLGGALLNGATLCPFDVKARGAPELARWVASARITHLHAVPTLYRKLLAALGGDEDLSALRWVDVAGEALHGSDAALHRSRMPASCSLVHRLAATEASFISHHVVPPTGALESGAVPVGRLAEGMEARILREDGSEAAAGEAGEIVLRSAYLSPGYWGLPERSAAVFSPDPEDPRLRRFATGDRGRLREDGELEHLGRLDTRVKIHGFAVDPLEVEAALRGLERVRDSAVVDRSDGRGGTALVAFVVPEPGARVTRARLRAGLLERLPAYMVPGRFEPIDAFPLTATGKVDRRALSERAARRAAAGPPVEPQDTFEADLLRIWRQELEIPDLGIRDDFFEIGGDSLAAVQIFTRIEETLGRALPTSTLHQASTVEALASQLRRADIRRGETLLHPFRVHGSLPPLFAIPGRGGDPIVFSYMARGLSPERPFYGLAAPGLIPGQVLLGRFEAWAAAFLEQIRGVQPEGPYFLMGFSSGAVLAWEVARQLLGHGEKLGALAMIDGWAPGYPRSAPGRPRLHHLFDHGPGRGIPTRKKTTLARIAGRMIKDGRRELACRIREARGKALTRRQRFRRVTRRHTRSRTGYRSEALPLRISLVRVADAELPPHFLYEPHYGWRDFALGGVDVYDLPGVHDDLISDPNAGRVGRLLEECLSKGS